VPVAWSRSDRAHVRDNDAKTKVPPNSIKMQTAATNTDRVAPSGEVLIKIEKITKRFPGVLALDGANLEIRRGEVHALLGENGAGKSTLIKLLSGVYQPDGGSISVRGEKVDIPHPSRAQALGITTIYQEHTLAPDLSPIENVFLGREVRRSGPLLNEQAMRARTRQLWREFGAIWRIFAAPSTSWAV
jgi:ribose transport system ATP-binding protein